MIIFYSDCGDEEFCSECGSELGFPRVEDLCYECFCLRASDEEIEKVNESIRKGMEDIENKKEI